MAVYDFRCSECEQVLKNVVLNMSHEDDDHPACYQCGQRMIHYITSAPLVLWKDGDLPDGSFIAGKDRRRITTRKDRREFMAENDLVDSNDLIIPPTHEEQLDTQADIMRSIDAITPDAKQKEQMKSDGILDIV
jgi:hypothetical protein